MQRRSLLFVGIILALATTLACQLGSVRVPGGSTTRGSGNITEETRNVSGVNGVTLATIGTLHIQSGSETSLTIRAEDNIIPLIQTNVTGGVLTIDFRPFTNVNPTRPVDYYLTVPTLDRISTTSSGDIEVGDMQTGNITVGASSSGGVQMGALTCDNLTLRLSSSGSITIDTVNGTQISARLSSSGDLAVNGGQVTRQELNLSSSGDYEARNLDSQDATIRLSSSGRRRSP